MKKIAFSIVLIALMAGISMAQTNEKDEMLFEKVLHDFGSINFGSDGTVDFTFKNNSKAPIVLTDVKSSCGCTVPTWEKEPIQPGASSSIKVKYDTKLPGVFNKTVTVYSTAKNSPVRLTVMGRVQAQPSDIKATQKTGIQQANQEKQRQLEIMQEEKQGTQSLQTGSSIRGVKTETEAGAKMKTRANTGTKSGGGNIK